MIIHLCPIQRNIKSVPRSTFVLTKTSSVWSVVEMFQFFFSFFVMLKSSWQLDFKTTTIQKINWNNKHYDGMILYTVVCMNGTAMNYHKDNYIFYNFNHPLVFKIWTLNMQATTKASRNKLACLEFEASPAAWDVSRLSPLHSDGLK